MNIIIGFLIFAVLLIVWYFGGHLVCAWPNVIKPEFGETQHLENTFAPISALFAAFASAGALYAIFLQGRQFHVQQFQSNFYTLLKIYTDSKHELQDRIQMRRNKQEECFEFFIRILRIVYMRITLRDAGELNVEEETIVKKASELIDLMRGDSGVIDATPQEVFRVAYKAFTQAAQPDFQSYFRKLYQLIKYVNSDSPRGMRSIYMAIIRAEFSIYEQVMVYYDVLYYRDDSSLFKATKFKSLIERNKLLHNMETHVLFDNRAAGEYRIGAYSSFSERGYSHIKRVKCQILNGVGQVKHACEQAKSAVLNGVRTWLKWGRGSR